MSQRINPGAFALGMRAPEQKHSGLSHPVDHADDSVGEALPAPPLMRSGKAPLYCERTVQQQYALCRPTAQIAVRGGVNSDIIPKLFKNIL